MLIWTINETIDVLKAQSVITCKSPLVPEQKIAVFSYCPCEVHSPVLTWVKRNTTAFHLHFGSDVTTASFAFNLSRGRGTLTRAVRWYAATQTRNKGWCYVTSLPKCWWKAVIQNNNLPGIGLPDRLTRITRRRIHIIKANWLLFHIRKYDQYTCNTCVLFS